MKGLKFASLAVILIATILILGCGENTDDNTSTSIGAEGIKVIDNNTIQAEINGKTATITFPEDVILPKSISPENLTSASPMEAKIIRVIDSQTIEAEVDGKTITITFPEGVDLSKLTPNPSQ